jgi:hypothetical protein
MQYKMVVRRTLFEFDLTIQGKVKLRSVHFLSNSNMKEHNDLLLVTENDAVQFFLDRSTPVSRLTGKQFAFISAASRYFGHMPDQKRMPVWLWAGSLDVPKDQDVRVQRNHLQKIESAYC